jgi:hypothetical protein
MMTAELKAEFKARLGGTKSVTRGDLMWCALDNTRVRFFRMVDSYSVEVTDNNGKILPDYRHPSQLTAY